MARSGTVDAARTTASTGRAGSTAELSRDGWTVLTAGDDGRDRTRAPRLRTVLMQVAAAGVIVAVLVAVVGAAIARNTAESQSVHEAAQRANVLAESVVQPALTNAMATSTAAAARLGPLLRNRVLTTDVAGSPIRVKIWSADGRILYSDEPRLVGANFGLDDEAKDAFADPQVRAEVSDLRAPENRYERGFGKLLEVYRPVWTPNGSPVLFETYFRYDQVSTRASNLWRAFAGIMISSIAAIVVLLVPVIWTLLARARRAQRERERMLARAVAASDDERRRIAATLHDGVVQDLVAVSYAVASTARDAQTRGDRDIAERLEQAGDAVRIGIGGMRSLLVDIYPASLRQAGIAAALADLADTVRGTVDLDVEPAAAAMLDEPRQEAVYRVAQECVRNAAKHADARTITVRLRQVGRDAVLEVTDDGTGFDAAGTRPEGHFGLSLITDLARDHHAELAVRSAPGAGTTWRLTMPGVEQ